MADKVLVVGLGFLGLPLAVKLYEAGCDVRAVKRTFTSDDVNLPVCLDCLDVAQDDYPQAWADCAVWVLLLPPSQVQDYAATMGRLLRHAEACGVRHLLFGSSVGVYGDAPRLCDENSEPQPDSASVRAIVAAEQACLAADIAHVDILRLGGLYAAERHPVFRLLAKGRLTDGGAPVNMLHRDAAVAALFRAAMQPNGRRVRNIVEQLNMSRAEFYRAEAAKLGCAAPDFVVSPDDTGKTVVTLFDDVMAAA